MTTPAFEIAELDASLALDGEDIIIRRIVGTTHQTTIDVVCRAFVRLYKPTEVAGTIIQGDSNVILSPTQINDAQWPGGLPVAGSEMAFDQRVPRHNDKAIIRGKVRNIEAAAPIYMNNELVRIELVVRG